MKASRRREISLREKTRNKWNYYYFKLEQTKIDLTFFVRLKKSCCKYYIKSNEASDQTHQSLDNFNVLKL